MAHENPDTRNLIVQSLYNYLREKQVYSGTLTELRSVLIKYTGQPKGWPSSAPHFSRYLYAAQPILEALGVTVETATGAANRRIVSLALTKDPEPGATALLRAPNAQADRPAVTLEQYESELCQGSQSALLREAALLLYSLGLQARQNPKLVKPWMEAAQSALSMAKDFSYLVETRGYSGQGDLAAFIEAEEEGQEQPPSPSPTAEGDSSMPSDPSELE